MGTWMGEVMRQTPFFPFLFLRSFLQAHTSYLGIIQTILLYTVRLLGSLLIAISN